MSTEILSEQIADTDWTLHFFLEDGLTWSLRKCGSQLYSASQHWAEFVNACMNYRDLVEQTRELIRIAQRLEGALLREQQLEGMEPLPI